jgi:hypothetical protein
LSDDGSCGNLWAIARSSWQEKRCYCYATPLAPAPPGGPLWPPGWTTWLDHSHFTAAMSSFSFGFGDADADAAPAEAASSDASSERKRKKVRRGKKTKKRKEVEEEEGAEEVGAEEPPKKKSKKKKKDKEAESADPDEGSGEAEDGAAEPSIDAVTISAADAASGMDIDRALKLAEKQRQKEKRAAKKAKAEREAAKAAKKKQRHRPAPAQQPAHDRRDSETPVWQACQEYLENWKHRKSLWKFQKVRQVWLLQHMYDTEQVSNDTFGIMVEYLEGLKGAGRTTTLAEAEKVLSKSASAEGSTSGLDGEESVVQRRAAAVIEVLQRYEQ